MTASAPAVGRVPIDDEVLMARFANGHPDAFDELYARYEAPLFGYCLRLLGDEAQAEDAFQETFTTVVEQRLRYRERGRFRSWLFTIARNACLDRCRRHNRRGRLLELAVGSEERTEPSAEREVELRDEVARALAGLSPEHRDVVLLHRYEGFSYAEIARMTGTTEAAAKQMAYRALLTLRERARE